MKVEGEKSSQEEGVVNNIICYRELKKKMKTENNPWHSIIEITGHLGQHVFSGIGLQGVEK